MEYAVDFILVFATIFLLNVAFWLWRFSGKRIVTLPMIAMLFKPRAKRKSSPMFKYTGKAILPDKVYENDSHNICINIAPAFSISKKDSRPFRFTKGGKSIYLKIPADISLQQFLEIELLAAGFKVKGEEKQQQNLSLQKLSYYWNCYFPNSGKHEISIIVRVATSEDTIELGVLHSNIKVVRLDNLTKRQIWLLASAAAIVSGCFGVAEVLHKLGMW